MLTRALSGTVYILVIIAAVWFSVWGVIALFALFAILGLVEYNRLIINSPEKANPILRNIKGSIYIVLPLLLIISASYTNKQYNPELIMGVFIIIWCADTFAYLVGRAIGKNKLAPTISPGKTIEGFIGGIIFSMLAGYILGIYYTSIPQLHWLIMAGGIAIVGTLGDLYESSLKRKANFKDSGNIIPGHGGVLDRLDSFLFAALFTYFYLLFI